MLAGGKLPHKISVIIENFRHECQTFLYPVFQGGKNARNYYESEDLLENIAFKKDQIIAKYK